MRSLIHASILALATLSLAPSAHSASQDIHGVYYLTGVREVGAHITLSSDGQFEFALSYGAVDQAARGSWTAKGDLILLKTAPLPPPSFTWQPNQPVLHERCMGEPEVPVALAVCLSGPGPSIPSTEFKITAEFSNGLRRSGVPKGGRIHFVERAEPEWTGAKVKRLLMEVPHESVQTWIDVPSENKTAIIELASGRLVRPAFEQAKLRVLRRPKGPIAVVMLGEVGQLSEMEFVKHGESK